MSGDFSKAEILEFKRLAAGQAVDFITPGMVVGLGSGSTAEIAIEKLGEKIAAHELEDIIAVPTSKETERAAVQNGIPLTTLNKHPRIDLTIDGADEVDPNLNLIKGAGGALFREKIVETVTVKLLIVVDESKLSDQLGINYPVPVEVFPLAVKSVSEFAENLGAKVVLRMNKEGKPYVTEQGNNILDCRFGPIDDPHELATQLSMKPGVVEHGLFLDMASSVIVGGQEGIRILQR